jgi:hypothetical protein
MEAMLVALVLYSIWAAAVLVWSTLLDEGRMLSPQMSRGGFEYVAIPDHSFLELMDQHPNLVIFDVHADRGACGWSELISYWLPISAGDLPRVLKWLPPASRVVFCCKNTTEQLGTRIKTILLQLGIGRSISWTTAKPSGRIIVTRLSQQTQPIEKSKEEH